MDKGLAAPEHFGIDLTLLMALLADPRNQAGFLL